MERAVTALTERSIATASPPPCNGAFPSSFEDQTRGCTQPVPRFNLSIASSLVVCRSIFPVAVVGKDSSWIM